MKRVAFCKVAAALAGYALPVLLLAACVHQALPMIQTSSGEVVPLEQWTATLSAPAGVARYAAVRDTNAVTVKLSGTVTLAPGRSIQETRATVTIAGGEPIAAYPWYVHLGQCGNDRGILSGPLAYPPIAVDSNGRGAAMVTLPFTIPLSGRYFVSVHQSDSEMSTAIACGNLTRGSASGGTSVGYAKTP